MNHFSRNPPQMQHYIICYDISEDRIRRKVVKFLEGFAWRIQYSVFRCGATERKMAQVKAELLRLTEKADHPLLLITPLCANCFAKVWQVGQCKEEEPAAVFA